MRLRTAFQTRLSADRAFAYLEDFGRIQEWDPFIRRAERLTPGPPAVGSVYLLVPRWGRFRLRYEVEALDRAARRIRLLGSAAAYSGWDEITVAPAAVGGSIVTYEADIRLRGRARALYLLTPIGALTALVFGGNAMRGMRNRLDALAAGDGGPAPDSSGDVDVQPPAAGAPGGA